MKMRKLVPLLWVMLCPLSFFAQTTYYSTGAGGNNLWTNLANWSLSPTGTPQATVVPGPTDTVVINHEILQNVNAGYTHFGDVFIGSEGFLTINTGDGNTLPYYFAGDTFRVEGRLTTSSDFHNQLPGSDGDGLFYLDTASVVIIGDDLILEASSETVIDNLLCGEGAAFDDLYFRGTSARLCGEGRFFVPDAIRVWDDNNNEILDKAGLTQLAVFGQVCPGFFIYGTPSDCIQGTNPIYPIEILPVEWAQFEVQERGGQVALSWSTLQEINNAFFTVERSADAREFEVLATVAGAGDAFQKTSYQWTDRAPLTGRQYYRIKQTDLDGQFSYSHLAEINVQAQAHALAVRPNPVNGASFEVQVSGFAPNQSVQLRIANLIGQEVYRQQLTTTPAAHTYVKVQRQLKPGVYFILAESQNHKVSKRLLVH